MEDFDKILFMDFELNQPLAYISKFANMLAKDGWNLDMFWAKDYATEKKPSFDDKLNGSDFLFIRKPLTFLTSPNLRQKLQNAVLNDKKSLLLMMSFSDKESLDTLREFLVPFQIEPLELRALDRKTNLRNKRSVVFHKKNKCFADSEMFKSVTKIVIPDANLLFVKPPAKMLICGNPSTETFDSIHGLDLEIKGPEVIVGAYYDVSGRLIVVNSSLFLDKVFEFNKPFIKNIISWLGSGIGKKKSSVKSKKK